MNIVINSGFSSAAPQSLADLFQSGRVNFTRDFVISEKEFPENVYWEIEKVDEEFFRVVRNRIGK